MWYLNGTKWDKEVGFKFLYKFTLQQNMEESNICFYKSFLWTQKPKFLGKIFQMEGRVKVNLNALFWPTNNLS